MKWKKRVRRAVAVLCALTLMIGNVSLSPFSHMGGSAAKVKAAENAAVDLTKLQEITWGDFGVETEETEKTIRFQLTANAKNGASGEITLWFMNADASGALGDAAHKEAKVTLGQATTLEYELEYFLNAEGNYTGFNVGVFTDGEYTITFDRIELVKEDGTTKTVSLAEKDLDYKFGTDTGFTGCSATGGITYGDNNVTITSGTIYSVHKLITKSSIIRFQVTANAKNGASGEITLWFMNADASGALGDAAHKEAKVTLGQATTLEYELEYFLNAEGKYEGFSVGVFTDGEYTITFDRIELVKEDGTTKTVSLAEKDLDYKFGYDTGFNGCCLTGGVTYGDGNVTITSEEIYSVHKLITTIEGAILRLQLTANAKSGASGEITLWFMNADASGALGDAAHKEAKVTLGQATTLEYELEYFLNAEGNYTGFNVGVFTDGEYTITFDRIELVKEDGTTEIVSLSEQDVDYKFGYDTGFYGCCLTGGVTYGDGNVTITSEEIYSVHKLITTITKTLFERKTGATLDNTVFNGDIIFKEDGVFYYGAADSGLALSLTAEGELAISAADYTFFDPGIAATYSASDFGLETFKNEQFNLKIAMTEVTSDGSSAKIGVWINNIMVGAQFFTVTLNNPDGNTINNTILFNANAVLAHTKSIAGMPEAVPTGPANITWSDFSGAVYGKTYSSFEKVTYDGISMNNTLFEDEIIFSNNSGIRYATNGGWAGLNIGVTSDGKLKIGSDVFLNADTNTYFTKEYDAAYFGMEAFAGRRIKLTIQMCDVTETTARVTVWVNDIQVGDEISMVSTDAQQYKLGCDVGMVTDGTGSVTIPRTVPVPTDLQEITWEDFGISCIGSVTDQYKGRALSGRTLNNTLFNGDITMQAGSHIRYGGSAGDFGLHIQVTGDGNLRLYSDTCTFDSAGTVYSAALFGVESLADTRFNLKIAVTDFTETTATVGVWVNDFIVGDYFTLTCTGDWGSSLGNNIALYSGTMEAHSILAKPTGLTSVKFADFNIANGVYPNYGINGASHNTLSTLQGTSFRDTVKFSTTNSMTDTLQYALMYGGTSSGTWYGVRISLLNDTIVIHSAGEFGSFTLTSANAKMSTFTNQEFQLGMDTVKYGEHVLLYMYFDGYLYCDAPIVLENFADKMSNTLVFTAPGDDTLVIGSSDKTLEDLYHDLEKGAYRVPAGLISLQKKGADGLWTDVAVSGGSTLNVAGDYKIMYNDGLSNYIQEVVLYRAGDVKVDDAVNVADLVRKLKYVHGMAYDSKSTERAADVDKDGVIDTNTDTKANTDVTALRRILLGTYTAEDERNIMPVAGYYGPIGDTLNDAVFQLVKEAGINQVTQYQNEFTDSPYDRYAVYQQLTLAQKYNLRITVQDNRLTADSTTATQESVQNAIADYKDYQSFKGLYITDEPEGSYYPAQSTSDRTIDRFSALAQAINAQGIYGYANLQPYLYKNVSNKTAYYAYTNHLREYVDQFDATFLSFDYYPFWTYAVNEGLMGDGVENASQYFENLAMVRYVAKEKEIPFWAFVQAGDGFELENAVEGNPSEGEFKWQANTSLAFGAKGIQYFPLVKPYFFPGESSASGLIGSDGLKTEWYDYAVAVNRQIAAIDEVLMNAENEGLMATGGYAKSQAADRISSLKLYKTKYAILPTETLTTPVYTTYAGATVTSADTTYGALTGCFTYGSKHALYIVNYNVTDSNTVTVSFDSGITAEVTLNANTETQTGTSIRITLGAGEGALVVY